MNIKRDKKKDLEILGLSGIFQGIADNNRSGILSVQSGNQEKYIYFDHGNIKMIASPHRTSVLAEGMRRAFGQIDDDVLQEAFHIQRSTSKSLSEILIELNADQKFIENLCRSQIREEIFELFIWEDMQFEFLEGGTSEELFSKELLSLDISITPSIIFMEMAGRLDEWKNISEVFPSSKDIPYISADIYSELEPEQHHLLTITDGSHDFEEIFAQCRLPYFQMMKTFYILKQEKQYLSLRTASELKDMAKWNEVKADIFKCIKLYERAEELGGQDQESIHWLAEAYESSGLISKAIIKYRQLGELSLKKQDYDGAIRAYSKVITYSQEDSIAHKNYIFALFESSRFEEGATASIAFAKKLASDNKRRAIQVLENAYQHNPLSPEILEYMASLYWELEEYNAAISNYTMLANLYKVRKLYQDTISSYQKILTIDYNNIQARIELANTYLLMNEQARGVEEYKKLGDILCKTVLQDSFGFNYLITVCEKIIQFEPDNIQAREWLADVYIYHGDVTHARELLLELMDFLQDKNYSDTLISVLQKLVQIEPKNRSYRRMLAEIYHRMQYYEEATKELVCIANLAIEDGTLHLQNKDEQVAIQILSESLDALNLVLIIEPFNLEVRQKRAELLHQLGYTQDAVHEYKLVCNMTKAVHNYHDALTALFHIIELAPDYEPGAFLEMAKLCERQNKMDLAINFYKKYAKRSLMRGDFGEALQTCRRLLTMLPNDSDVMNWRNIATQVSKN